ncbi:hypothetical protein RRF57_009048 [Xylaria bambusicola]|uniref:Uncharacterized protein n=1 Tax=Xylaria bambusicola TaxID=326684 RepID=A0AAN7Z192_9PEZI
MSNTSPLPNINVLADWGGERLEALPKGELDRMENLLFGDLDLFLRNAKGRPGSPGSTRLDKSDPRRASPSEPARGAAPDPRLCGKACPTLVGKIS